MSERGVDQAEVPDKAYLADGALVPYATAPGR